MWPRQRRRCHGYAPLCGVELLLCALGPACSSSPIGAAPPAVTDASASTRTDIADIVAADAASVVRTDTTQVTDAPIGVETMLAIDAVRMLDVPRAPDAAHISDVPHTTDAALIPDTPRTVDATPIPDAPRVTDTFTPQQVDGTSGQQRAWQGPESIENFSDFSYIPNVVMDEQGNVTTIWSGQGVAANRFDHQAGAWREARILNDAKRDATTPSLALDGRGNVAVVWEQLRDLMGPPDVYGTRFEISLGDWQAPGLIAETESKGAIDPVVALDNNGDGIAVWLETNPRHSLHQDYFVGGSWQGASKLLDLSSGNPTNPQLAVDSSGNITMLWYEYDGPHTGLYLRRLGTVRSPGSTDVTLSSEPCFVSALVVDGSGAGAATWVTGMTEARLHVAYLSQPDGLWQEEPLPDTIPTTEITPSVAVRNQATVLVWKQGHDEGDVLASRRGPDGVWQSPVLIGRGAGPYARPRAGFDGNGNIIATWHQGPYLASRVVAARYDSATGTWGEPVLLDNGADSAQYPNLAVNGAGQAVVIWEQERGGVGSHLWANRWE